MSGHNTRALGSHSHLGSCHTEVRIAMPSGHLHTTEYPLALQAVTWAPDINHEVHRKSMRRGVAVCSIVCNKATGP